MSAPVMPYQAWWEVPGALKDTTASSSAPPKVTAPPPSGSGSHSHSRLPSLHTPPGFFPHPVSPHPISIMRYVIRAERAYWQNLQHWHENNVKRLLQREYERRFRVLAGQGPAYQFPAGFFETPFPMKICIMHALGKPTKEQIRRAKRGVITKSKRVFFPSPLRNEIVGVEFPEPVVRDHKEEAKTKQLFEEIWFIYIVGNGFDLEKESDEFYRWFNAHKNDLFREVEAIPFAAPRLELVKADMKWRPS